jgi:hypothetical protein
MISKWIAPAFLGATLVSLPVLAQQTFVYPARGQSPQQQQKDEYQCYQWAVQQTGYDPARPTAQHAVASSPPSNPMPGSIARGALFGAVIGGIGGNDVGNAAAKGAIFGLLRGFQRSRRQEQQMQRQAQQQAAAGPEAYNRARTACLTGRGYSVN